ncbi:MAG: hypothetical protein AB1609_17595 [Bacillota bacterium]
MEVVVVEGAARFRRLLAFALAVCLVFPAVARAGPLAIQEEYVDAGGVDLAGTDARLIPGFPGLVELPLEPSSVAADRHELVVCTSGRLRVWLHRPEGLLKVLDSALPSAGAACSAGGKLYIARQDGFSVYLAGPRGLSPAGPGVSGLSGVTGVAVGHAGRVYVACRDRVRCFAPAVGSYVELPSGGLAVAGVTAISADPASGAVVVATGRRVRYFVPAGERLAEVPWGCELPAPVDGLALSPGGKEYRVLAGGELRTYRVAGGGAALPCSAQPLGRGALRVGDSGDAVPVLCSSGVRGHLRGSGDVVPVPALSDGSFRVARYRWRAMLLSREFVTGYPVNKVLVAPVFAALPEGSSVSWEVSTDGGASWTPVVPGRDTPVPPGAHVRYRALIEGPGPEPEETPSLDRLGLVELWTVTRPVPVRLIR